jgi:hypothetical protein
MDDADIDLRNATYRLFVELGRAPTAGEVSAAMGIPEGTARETWRRLQDAHGLVLDDTGEIRMANPFAAQPTPFRVQAAGRSWFANCAWDAFGIGAALRVDSTFAAECADCGHPLAVSVHAGQPDDTRLMFHVLVPASSWWNDIGFT